MAIKVDWKQTFLLTIVYPYQVKRLAHPPWTYMIIDQQNHDVDGDDGDKVDNDGDDNIHDDIQMLIVNIFL